MDIAEKEYRQRKENVPTTKSVKIEKTPTWFNKDIEEDSATEEEIKAFEALLKGNE